jgi:hypothetical protein
MSDDTDYRYTAAELATDLDADVGTEIPIAAPPSIAYNEHKNATAERADAIKRLAALSPIEYDCCREQEAMRLGVRVTTVDDEVKRLQPRSEVRAETGSAVVFDELEPWPGPVDSAALLDALAETFSCYLIFACWCGQRTGAVDGTHACLRSVQIQATPEHQRAG